MTLFLAGNRKLWLTLAFLAIFSTAGLYVFSKGEEEILRWVQHNQSNLKDWVARHPFSGAFLYMILFAAVVGFYIPGAIILLLLSGALFPLGTGILLASTGNLFGALIGFTLSKKLLYADIQSRFPDTFERINRGVRQHGGFYLFLLRLAPLIPSPIVNLAMGLTPISAVSYMAATYLGRLPMTAVYANLGREIATIHRLSDLVSMEIIVSLLAVTLLALGANHLLKRHFDR